MVLQKQVRDNLIQYVRGYNSKVICNKLGLVVGMK